MSERLVRPTWVRRLNAMADASGGADVVVPLDGGELVDAAVSSTGLSDFGDLGDGDWEGRLRALVGAINASPLHVVGRLMTREEMARSLRTRLFLAYRRRAAPAIIEEPIVAPVVVTGPARSGTTILFELLSLDPSLHIPRAADMLHPAPPAGVRADALLRMSECEQELWADVQPEFAAMHELRSDLPVECVTINVPSFAGSHWLMCLSELGDWTPDPAAEFAYHRAVLQTVQFGRPRRSWLLKTPAYVTMMDDLFAAYPDATVIQTHRDPARTMPSTVSITATVRWMRTDDVPLDDLSALIGAVFSDALASVSTRRSDGEWEGRFGDVRFSDLMTDPVAAVGVALSAIGRPFTQGHAAAVADYVAAKPRHAHGVHAYTAAEWGFSVDRVRADMAGYIAENRIVLED